ncbi:MAG: HEAT repeat domain-containing protein [Verrucomicrobiota bacterium]
MSDEVQLLPEEKSRPVTLIVQLVIIPLVVVLFCVGLGALFMWITSERKDFDDYVKTLRASSGTKRGQEAQYLLNYIQESKKWQGIFDVTAQISAGPDDFLMKNPQAAVELRSIFDESAGQDAKTRRYVALVLGLLGDKESAPVLRQGLNDSDPDTVKNCLWALARLQDNEAAGPAMELTRHADPNVRLMAVYALGFFENPRAREVLVASLNDSDELVKWNAAFALANRSDVAGRAVLVRLLDKEYVDRQVLVTMSNRSKYRAAATVWLAKLDGKAAIPMLEKIATDDVDLRVRDAALKQLEILKHGS